MSSLLLITVKIRVCPLDLSASRHTEHCTAGQKSVQVGSDIVEIRRHPCDLTVAGEGASDKLFAVPTPDISILSLGASDTPVYPIISETHPHILFSVVDVAAIEDGLPQTSIPLATI